jgi:hypothetical protein
MLCLPLPCPLFNLSRKYQLQQKKNLKKLVTKINIALRSLLSKITQTPSQI